MTNLFSNLQAALFDLDGTLIETHIDFDLMRCEVARLAQTFGLDVPSPRDILTGVEALRNRLQSEGRPEDAARFRTEAFAMLREIEVEHCGKPGEIPGAARLLEVLEERGIAVGIVTRNCRAVSEMLLERGRLKCRCLITRDDVPRTKPDPGHLLAAVTELQSYDLWGFRRNTKDTKINEEHEEYEEFESLRELRAPFVSSCSHSNDPTTQRPIDPTACLMVGDHFMDVQAGRGAGMRTVGVLRGKPASHFDICKPDVLVEGPADLLVMLEAIP